MGLISRFSTVVKSKISRLLDRAEDPRETLDYSYEKQRDMLRDVKRGVVEVTASKRRLEMQVSQIKEQSSRLDEQARQALSAGREDLARTALQRKQTALMEIEGLDTQIANLEKQQDQLTAAEQRLSTKVESFRTQKEVIKAQYSAAEASVRIGEALTGVSEEMADVGLAAERAKDKTAQMQARAGAIDELTASGFLEDIGNGEDKISRELAQITSSQNVDQELAAMKRELGAGEPPRQLQEGR